MMPLITRRVAYAVVPGTDNMWRISARRSHQLTVMLIGRLDPNPEEPVNNRLADQ
jgi:hypothetical protein